jgi:Raf kinase inhibitor-like YbhB/YbcL family protein
MTLGMRIPLLVVVPGACAAAFLVVGLYGTGGYAMELNSDAFDAGASVPEKHTCDGEDLSPALAWSGTPEGTASFVLIMDDPDAPSGTWVHWVLFNLPADGTTLEEGLPKTETVDGGVRQGACWGVNRFSRVGYHGPCPPPGQTHRYVFRLYALDTMLDLPGRSTQEAVLSAAEGHVLAEAELMGTYGR